MTQPTPPPSTAPRNQADSLGIVSILLALTGFSLPGIVVGIIGVTKAKRELRPPTLSHIGWILSLLMFIVSCVIVVAMVIFYAINSTTSPATSDKKSQPQSNQTLNTRQITQDGFHLTVPTTFSDLPAKYANSNASYAQGDAQKYEYAMVIKEPRGDFASTMTAQEYATLIIDQHGDTLANFTATRVNSVDNPQQYDAVDYRITGTIDAINVVYYSRFLRTESSFYQVTTWTIPSKEVAAKSDLLNIITSFREQ